MNLSDLCDDLHITIYSFLLYNDCENLQLTSHYFFNNKKDMNKYCQHIHPHGIIKVYNKEIKIYESDYKEGKCIKEIVWYENGQLEKEMNYYKGNNSFYNGKLNGIKKEWYPNGQLWYEENYIKGELKGIQKYWYENGDLFDKCFILV